MPVIRQNKEQQQALEFVTKALEMTTATAAVTEGLWSGSATIQFSAHGKSRRGGLRVTLDEDDKEISNLMKLIRNYRQRICKEAIARAQKYNIDLTPEETAILTGEDQPKEDATVGLEDKMESHDTQETKDGKGQGEGARIEETWKGGESRSTAQPPTSTSDYFQSGSPQETTAAEDNDDVEFAAAMEQLRG